MKRKSFSEAVCAACWIAAIVVVLAECASAQIDTASTSPYTTTPKSIIKKQSYGSVVKWNNSDFFKDKPSPKLFNWRTYPETWDGKQFVLWGVFAVSGMLWGAREAYHADPYVFERVYGVGETSFCGSDAWKRNYIGNDPDKPHKKEVFGNMGRDVWHTFGFASNALLFSGTFTIGQRHQPAKYRALNLLLGLGARSLFASLTYNSLRSR